MTSLERSRTYDLLRIEGFRDILFDTDGTSIVTLAPLLSVLRGGKRLLDPRRFRGETKLYARAVPLSAAPRETDLVK